MINRQRKIHRIAAIALLITHAVALWVLGDTVLMSSAAAQPAQCTSPFLIERTMTNGAKWDMCWEVRSGEGMVLSDIHYRPIAGPRRKVLAYAGIGQIHVIYDDNGARFHDISDYGLGGTQLVAINDNDCRGGSVRRTDVDGNNIAAVCVRDEARGFAYASGSNRLAGERLTVFSISAVGKYNYIIQWAFNDDGSIEPGIGATGSLQRIHQVDAGSGYQRGWLTRNNSDGMDTYGISHTHNYYWRLDFDLDGTWTNDIVEEIEHTPAAGNRQRRLNVRRLTRESARTSHSERMRSWRIRDGAKRNRAGQSISYHLEPLDVGHRDVGPLKLQQPRDDVPAWLRNEPWTQYDFFVSVNKTCEQYATRNPPFTGDDDNALLGDDSCLEQGNVTEFVGIDEFPDNPARDVKGPESIINQDIVVWYGMSFYHLPRDEDDPHMHTHWSGFKLVPRDWHDFNPTADGKTLQLELDAPATGKYGHLYGRNLNYAAVNATFQGTSDDIIVRVRGFDIDRYGEVDVLLNNRRIGRLAETKNRREGNLQQFFIPAAKQRAVNRLTFEQRSPGDSWGIRDLEIASITGAVISPQQNQRDRGKYGNKYAGNSSHPDAVRIKFARAGNNWQLSLRGYDIDNRGEVKLLLNGKTIGNLSVTPNNDTSRLDWFTIRNRDLIDGENTLTLFQKTHGYRWGVTDIRLHDGS